MGASRSIVFCLVIVALRSSSVEAMTGVVLGLNSAYQRCIQCDKMVLGGVNRAKSSSAGVGGKGQGAYLAGTMVSETEDIRLAQFVGGSVGDLLCKAIRRRRRESDESLWIQTASETRVCTTIVHGDDATEFVEPSGIVAKEELESLELKLKGLAPVKGLLCSGSLPPGVSSYASLISAAQPHFLLLDTVVLDSLESIKKDGMKVIMKLNAREVLTVAGLADPNSNLSDSARPRPADAVARAAQLLCTKFAIDIILYTDGPFDAGAFFADENKLIPLKKAFKTLPGPLASPIGAGDTVAGTTFARLLTGDDSLKAFAFGLSCGAASCLTSENAAFDLGIIDKLPYEPILES